MQTTISNGERSSSAASYLGPSYIDRPNLSVLVGARVTRVLPSTQDKTVFNDVEFISSNNGDYMQESSQGARNADTFTR